MTVLFISGLSLLNLVVIWYDLGLAYTPICESHFHEEFSSDHLHRWPACFANNAAPWDGSDHTGTWQFPWRGSWEVVTGIGVAVLIDVLYTDVLAVGIASGLVSLHNYKTQSAVSSKRVSLTYPLEFAGYFGIFLLLAFLYIPFGADAMIFFNYHAFSSSEAQDAVQLSLKAFGSNATATNATSTSSNVLRIWFENKRA